MVKSRQERYKDRFESVYGPGKWEQFVAMVTSDTRAHVVQESFVSLKSGLTMSKPPYYMWESRARELGKR